MVRCKHCQFIFLRNLENCPSCGKKGPEGRRHALLKWIAVFIFLIAIAFVGCQLIGSMPGLRSFLETLR